MFFIQLLTSPLQREAKARSVEAGKKKKAGRGGERNNREPAGVKKGAFQMRGLAFQ